ncbi:MAG: glycosyltransferase family 4 protein [Desulfobacterales bacterium]|nr:glycosyltransferase family 4 protein [Deltaproteobacteria bacterium]MBT8359744.1 glycosyltransferase family 4 protein [Deltaproteobacteria bacterium]NNK95613.1 glycosyltransferase family 4 protein [Desulfobacterales bacterium]
MRIGLIIYGNLNTLTGGYLYDRIMVEGLIKRGHEVEVISLESGSYLRRLLLGFSSGLYRRLLAGKFDIIIEDELCHPSLFFVNKRLRRQAGPLLVALVHHALCKEPRHRWHNMLLSVVERWYLASVDGFIYNSQSTQRTVASLVDHERPQVIVYPAGDRFGSPLSEEFIGKRAQRSGALELLFLGNVIPRKGLLPLLRALAEVERDVWHLSIVGGLEFDSIHAARAQQLVKQLGLSDSVRFLGPLEDDRLVEILRTSHIFCMPYAYEGFGIAILEAMAFGLPAIGCRDGAAFETISQGINGFLLAPDDLGGLRPLLVKLHGDREELKQLALAARATCLNRSNWQDSTVAIDEFLQNMKRLDNQKKNTTAVKNARTTGRGDSDVQR